MLLAVAAARVDWPAVSATLGAGAWKLVALAAVAYAGSSVAKALTWQGLLVGLPAGRGRSGRLDLVVPLFVGALVNGVALARAGDAVKVALAHRRAARRGAPISVADLAGAMLAEHVVATVAWAVLVLAVAAVAPMPPAVTLAAAALGLVCAGFAVTTAARAPGACGCRLGDDPAPWRRALRAVGRAWEAVHHSHRGLGRPRVLAWVSAAALAQWVLAWLAVMVVLAALGLGRVGPAGAALVLVSLTLAHALPITPGGIGVNQVGAMLPLTATYGVMPEEALAFAVALTLSETGVGMLLGGACAIVEAAGRGRTDGGRLAPAPVADSS